MGKSLIVFGINKKKIILKVGARTDFGKDFKWIYDGSSLNSSSSWWCKNEPNFKKNQEYCLQMVTTRNIKNTKCLSDVSCFDNYHALCKIHKKQNSQNVRVSQQNVNLFRGFNFRKIKFCIEVSNLSIKYINYNISS